jgi:hypothetical protein
VHHGHRPLRRWRSRHQRHADNPAQVAVDSQGDIYYFDRGADVVREVTGATTAVAYGSQTLGSFTPLTVTVNNSGSQPLAISERSAAGAHLVFELHDHRIRRWR